MTTRREVTIKDVAAAAGVSTATVSRTLTGASPVDDATRQRVLAAAEALGYRPNRLARGLRTARSAALGILLPPGVVEDGAAGLEFYMRLVNGAAAAAFERDHALTMLVPGGGLGETHAGVDGVIVVDPVRGDPRLEGLSALGTPVVTVGRDPGTADDGWSVDVDNAAMIELVLDHLRDAGAERVGIIVPDTDVSWTAEVLDGYRAITAAAGAAPIVGRVGPPGGAPDACTAAAAMLADPEAPDAIIALGERHHEGVLRAARAAGRRVPDDLLVVAGVDSSHARDADPAITAVDLRPHALAGAAVELLLERVAGGPAGRGRRLPVGLRARRSTARGDVG